MRQIAKALVMVTIAALLTSFLQIYFKTMDEKAIFKFNNGNGALLCSKCRVIIKTGRDFTEEEIKAIKEKVDMPPQYCDKCKK
jgi:hypothetical protein